MMRNSGVRRPRATRSSSTARHAASLSPPMLRTASSTFCPSRRTPSTTSSEMAVALRSSRTRTTVPSRISRTMSSPAEVAPAPGLPVRLHLAPGAADHVLAHRAPEQRAQRAPDPARVGAGQVGAGDQRLHLPRHPGVAGQHGAAPFPRGAVPGVQPGPRHGDLHRPEGAGQPPLPMAVPMARDAAALIAPASKRLGQLLLDQLLDEAADPPPQPGFDRVEPSRPGEQRRLARVSRCYPCPWRGLRRRANAGHGSLNKPETTPPPFPTTSATAPGAVVRPIRRICVTVFLRRRADGAAGGGAVRGQRVVCGQGAAAAGPYRSADAPAAEASDRAQAVAVPRGAAGARGAACRTRPWPSTASGWPRRTGWSPG